MYKINTSVIQLYFQSLCLIYIIILYCINDIINIMNETYELSYFINTKIYCINGIINNCDNSSVSLYF